LPNDSTTRVMMVNMRRVARFDGNFEQLVSRAERALDDLEHALVVKFLQDVVGGKEGRGMFLRRIFEPVE